MSETARSADGQRHGRVVKPRKISINGDKCAFHTLFRQWVVTRDGIESVELGRTLSLVDEIAMTVVYGGKSIYIPETLPGFHDLARWLDIAACFGEDWYHRTETGEHLLRSNPHRR